MGVFIVLFAVLCLFGFALLGLAWFFRRLHDRWDEWSWSKRLGFFGAGVVVIASPFLVFKVTELRFVLARVPEPLHVSWIEYRLEESWGIGLPGDNETGFVIYRLTNRSADWARSKGPRLREFLSGGPDHWHPTPVDDGAADGRWHPYDDDSKVPPHRANIREYLDKYGFSIPVEKDRAGEADWAIQRPGSFYSYGRSGSITIVDPQHGKVYFAYAG